MSVILTGFFVSAKVQAATGINKQINFQGKVVNTNGTNVSNASYNFLFCIYTTASPATPCTAGADNDAIWRESKSLTVTDGIFQTNLGDTTAFASLIDFNTDNIYLGVNFNSDGQMSPLVRFTAAPYALNAFKVGGLTVTDTTGTLTIPSGETISFAESFATSGAFATTLTATGTTNVTLPTTGTLATLAGVEVLTNKSVGSTGLTFSGATTDITTASGESLVVVAAGAGTVDIQDATNVDSLTTDIGGISIATSQSYTGAGAVTLSSATASDLTINSGTTGTINIGTDASAETINIGNTGAAVKTIAIGNNSQANTITIGTSSATGVSITDNNWSVTAAGAATFVSIAGPLTGNVTGNADTVTGFTPASGSLTLSGADALTLTTTDTTNVTLPTTGTLATLAGAETLSGKTLTAPKFVDLGFIADANGNEILVLDTVTTAVPYLQLSNNTTGLNPVITGAGEANTGIDFLTSGTGALRVLGNATQAGELRFYEDTDNGTNFTAFKVGTQGGDVTYTLPTGYPAVTGYVLSATDAGVMSWVASSSGVPTQITVENEAADTSSYVAFFTAATGDLEPKTNAGLTFNASTGVLTATGFAGPLTGNVTGNVSGTAATVTSAAQTAITSVGTLTGLTMGGTLAMGSNSITGTTGIIDYTGFDVDASGNLDALGTVTAGSGNISLTDATGNILHDALVACADTQILKYTTGTAWGCAADDNSGGATAWNAIGDAASNGAIAMGTTEQTMDWDFTTTAHDGLTFNFDNNGGTAGTDNGLVINNAVSANASGDMATETLLLLQQLDTTGSGTTNVDNFIKIDVAGSSGATDGIEITNSAGNLTNGINIVDTAGGTLTTGLLMSGSITTAIDLTDTNIGTGINLGANDIVGTTGIINYTGFDVDASGNLDALGTLTAGSSNIAVTDSTGHVQHDSIVDCGEGEILKWTAAGQWACAADDTGGGGGHMDLLAEDTLESAANNITLTVAAREFLNCYLTTKGNTATAITWLRFNSDAGANYDYQLNYNIATAYVETQGLAQNQIVLNTTDTESMHAQVQISNFSNVDKNVWLRANRADRTTGPDNFFGSGSWRNTSAQITTVAFLTSTSTFLAGSHAWCEGRDVADYAENYYSKDLDIEAGDVVTHDPTLPAGIKKSSRPYDPQLIGSISTKPAIVLDDAIGFGQGWQYPVALAGRIPVKVNTENGPIKSGDPLTSSSQPGVAMKATKAGAIIGQAMESFDGEGVGRVMTFVKTSYYNGASSIDLISTSGDIVNADQSTNSSAMILNYIVNEKLKFTNDTVLSEVMTDRVVAGLEIITPRVVTQEIATDVIKSSLTNVLSVQLGADGAITFGEPGKDPTSRIDAFGNATFSGVVTAKTIRAESIEGLEVYTDSVKSLAEKYANLETLAYQEVAAPSVVENLSEESPSLDSVLKNLSLDTLTVNLDAAVLGKLTVSGALTIGGVVEFQDETTFQRLATFFGDTFFGGRVLFEKIPTFSRDTAGFAVIGEGQRSVNIVFDEKYAAQPIVSVSLTSEENPLLVGADKDLKEDIQELEADFVTTYFTGDIKYLVTKKSENGFSIILNKDAPRDLQFSWVALAVKDTKIFYSEEAISGSDDSIDQPPILVPEEAPPVLPTEDVDGDVVPEDISVDSSETPVVTEGDTVINSPSLEDVLADSLEQ